VAGCCAHALGSDRRGLFQIGRISARVGLFGFWPVVLRASSSESRAAAKALRCIQGHGKNGFQPAAARYLPRGSKLRRRKRGQLTSRFVAQAIFVRGSPFDQLNLRDPSAAFEFRYFEVRGAATSIVFAVSRQ